MTTVITAICTECGKIQKSGKLSCCSRGGSWFGHCGSIGNAHFSHAWYEGVRVCKARQFRTELEMQQHASQPKSNSSSDGISVDTKSREVSSTAYAFVSTSTNISATGPEAALIKLLAGPSIVSRLNLKVIANQTVGTKTNGTINKEIPNTINCTSTKATPIYWSANESLNTRGREKLSLIFIHINIIVVIFCWH